MRDRHRSTLDRAASLRGDEAWLRAAWERGQVLVIFNGRALVAGDQLVLVPAAAAPAGERLFMGVDGTGVAYFAVVAPLPDTDAADLVRPFGLREVAHVLSPFDLSLLAAATGLANWHERHPFSPSSGGPTTVRDAGWRRVDADGTEHFPRTDPAVIVLIHDGVLGEDGLCLLGRNAAWSRGTVGGLPRFSCLAGFVEPGETAEECLAREVTEEVGIAVFSLRYLGSQPWPYPGSLMLGFHALADPDETLNPDPAEIAEARWFTRAQVRRAIARDPEAGFGLPPPASIAYRLIVAWLDAPTP